MKWDGFRAIASTRNGLRVRSRRGWDMTALLPELEALPSGLLLDGELVALNAEGVPWFPDVCRRLLHRDRSVPLVYMVFDALALDGENLIRLPYTERRRLLDRLALDGPAVRTPEWFDDGGALWQAVLDRGLEGVVAKRLHSRYWPGERGWVKVKNPNYWRRESELEGFQRSIERRTQRAS